MPSVLKCLVLLLTCFTLVFARHREHVSTKSIRHARGLRRLEQLLSKKSASAPSPANSTHSSCIPSAPVVKAPKENVWASLTGAETAAIVLWLLEQKSLNLTAMPELKRDNTSMPSTGRRFPSHSWENSIVSVELLRPNKTDALSYLDAAGKEPTRYAHVRLRMAARENAVFSDIQVGPLPISNASSWKPLEYPYTKKSGGTVRDINADMDQLNEKLLTPLGKSIEDITLALWNATMTPSFDNSSIFGFPNGSEPSVSNLFPIEIDPAWQEDGRIIRWYTLWKDSTGVFDSSTLLPVGLCLMVETTGRDPSKWKFGGWFYNNVFYESTEAFRKAFQSPKFEKLGGGIDGPWAGLDRQGEIHRLDSSPPPAAVASSKPRYSVDPGQKYVEWMGFSFYIGFSRDTGFALFDIRYNGERVLYELGLQEAVAHYAGSDPVMSSVAYLDSFYGFGTFSFELVPGYDCPQYATFLNTSFYSRQTTHTHPNSICLFEFDTDHAMQRHSTGDFVSISKNTQFTVRSVATVGNYDYTFSYTFSLDGTISVDVRASGYIEAAHASHNEEYGFNIHDSLNGAMHDHVLNFKADFDVLGRDNSIQLVSNVPVSKTYPWSNGKVRNTMALKRRFLDNETSGTLDWDANSATQILVVNKDAKNRLGEYRAWRVQPSTPPVHLTVLNSSSLGSSARWAEHDVHITRQKDTEPRSADPYNNQDVHDPPVDFSRFLDGESLDQKDLVLWLNLGMHHVPTTADLPNTVMTTAHAGVKFVPANYFDGDQSRRSMSQVRISYADGKVLDVDTAGRPEQLCLSDLWSYQGDVLVRKFPYAPDAPYYERSGPPYS